jgi:hypothetical protein
LSTFDKVDVPPFVAAIVAVLKGTLPGKAPFPFIAPVFLGKTFGGGSWIILI